MPVLNWIGKDAVVNHDKDVPFRLLKKNKSKSVGDSENLIIEGDNLEALKALLPYYQNKIKCIFIDPPYNTGNEKWVYNDNVNSPKIKKWLGKVVGGEDEDLTRHDKWLCMMYPRLKLLKELLRDDGIIFVSLDDIEQPSMRVIMNEIFDDDNFFANIVWQAKDTPGNDAKGVAFVHNHILVYQKSKKFKPNLFERTEKQLANYKNPDGDKRGVWLSVPLTRGEFRQRDYYPLVNPAGKKIYPPSGNSWRRPRSEIEKLENDNRIWWGKKGDSTFPSIKSFLSEMKEGTTPISWWDYTFAGSTRNARSELKKLFEGERGFDTPKPTKLLKRIVQLSTSKEDIILDSFAGSGTTAQAVLELNKEDGGNRKFILVELEPEICKKITSERVKKVIQGYGNVAGTGGGFQYAVLDKKLFNADGRINDECTFEELASYIYFTETKTILDTKKIKKTLLDTHNETQIHLIFAGVGKNNLDRKFLTSLDQKKKKVIYADKCTLDDSTLEKYNTIFKQIPYEVREF